MGRSSVELVPIKHGCAGEGCAGQRYLVTRVGKSLDDSTDTLEILADEAARLYPVALTRELRHRVYELTARLAVQANSIEDMRRRLEVAKAESVAETERLMVSRG